MPDNDPMIEWLEDRLKSDPIRLEREKASYIAKRDALEAAHGIIPPAPKTPEEVRAEAIAQRFPEREIGDELSGQLQFELKRIEGLQRPDRDALVAELKKEHGGDAGYQILLDQARAALPAGETLTDAMAASRHYLAVMAAHGRYNLARQRAAAAS